MKWGHEFDVRGSFNWDLLHKVWFWCLPKSSHRWASRGEKSFCFSSYNTSSWMFVLPFCYWNQGNKRWHPSSARQNQQHKYQLEKDHHDNIFFEESNNGYATENISDVQQRIDQEHKKKPKHVWFLDAKWEIDWGWGTDRDKSRGWYGDRDRHGDDTNK